MTSILSQPQCVKAPGSSPVLHRRIVNTQSSVNPGWWCLWTHWKGPSWCNIPPVTCNIKGNVYITMQISSADLSTHCPLGDVIVISNVYLKHSTVTEYIQVNIALEWTPEDKATMVRVIAWCLTAPSHYLNQCWSRSPKPYDVTTHKATMI